MEDTHDNYGYGFRVPKPVHINNYSYGPRFPKLPRYSYGYGPRFPMLSYHMHSGVW